MGGSEVLIVRPRQKWGESNDLGKTMIRSRLHWQRPLLLILFAIAAFAVVMFGLRTYRSFLLLRSAYELGAPDVSSVRPWMTLDYVARAYHVPKRALAERLGLAPDTDSTTTLISLARKQALSPFEYLRQVQEAISELRLITPPPRGNDAVSEPRGFSDEILAALLVYGYPVLGLTLLLGTMGAPFPSALSVVVAGSLIAQGQMSWFWSGTIAVTCSVLGDIVGYGLGWLLGREFLEGRGRWFGFTAARRARVELLFRQWGVLCVLLSRSLISLLSSAVNLLAGAGRYQLRVFLPFAIVGRLIWTLAYLGLGYGFAVVLEASADFLSSLSGLLVSLTALAGFGYLIYRNHARLETTTRT
jgi:membrane-associated protein